MQPVVACIVNLRLSSCTLDDEKMGGDANDGQGAAPARSNTAQAHVLMRRKDMHNKVDPAGVVDDDSGEVSRDRGGTNGPPPGEQTDGTSIPRMNATPSSAGILHASSAERPVSREGGALARNLSQLEQGNKRTEYLRVGSSRTTGISCDCLNPLSALQQIHLIHSIVVLVTVLSSCD